MPMSNRGLAVLADAAKHLMWELAHTSSTVACCYALTNFLNCVRQGTLSHNFWKQQANTSQHLFFLGVEHLWGKFF